LFKAFDPSRFSATSIPGLTLAAAAYEHSLEAGEQVSLALREGAHTARSSATGTVVPAVREISTTA
jgi:hypothetical protein